MICQHCGKTVIFRFAPTLLGPWCQKCAEGYQKKAAGAAGYYCTPGTGPAGKLCKHCRHFSRIEHHDKKYFKCAMVTETRGPGSDIRASSPACAGFQEPIELRGQGSPP